MILLIIIAIRLAIWATVAMVWITVYFLYAVIIATVYIVGFTVLTVKYLYYAWRKRRARQAVERDEYTRRVAAFQAKLKVMDLREVHRRGLNNQPKGR